MSDKRSITEVRRACHQFARLYFHFCKTLVDSLGLDAATPLIQRAVFTLSLDRSQGMRKRAESRGLEYTVESMMEVNDLPFVAWQQWEPAMGGVRCPYAEVWLEYFAEHPWFRPLASLYCDVIDTTNIENFSRTTSHKITQNLLWGDASCERDYFPSEAVAKGELTYGKP